MLNVFKVSPPKIIVKHGENEKSITTTNKKHSKIYNFEIGFSFSLFFCLKRAKMNPSADPPDPADPADPADPVHGLPLGTSPTRAGGQDDVSSQANSLNKRESRNNVTNHNINIATALKGRLIGS